MTAASGPENLPVRQAYEMFLDAKRLDYTEETLRDYETRLRQFVEWAEDHDEIETVTDLTGWHIEQFKLYRQNQGLAPTTMKGQMSTLKRWLDYLVDIDALDDEMLPHKVSIPKLDQHEETSDVKLDTEAAAALLEQYRDAHANYGIAEHALLELTWYTGARLGAIYALDLGDVDLDEELVQFRHRPDTGAPLKKKRRGERAVGLPPAVCDVLRVYVEEHREPGHDKHGREPFFCTPQGRPERDTLRNWMYHATIPCRYGACPHDNREETCDWTSRNQATHCPSSRSPHQIRTGSITWQLNRGLTFEAVGERVNSDPDTLRRYYDKASDREKLEMRRREHLGKLDFEDL